MDSPYSHVLLLQTALTLDYGKTLILFKKASLVLERKKIIFETSGRLYGITSVCYHAFYLPLLYVTFLADFFQVTPSSQHLSTTLSPHHHHPFHHYSTITLTHPMPYAI